MLFSWENLSYELNLLCHLSTKATFFPLSNSFRGACFSTTARNNFFHLSHIWFGSLLRFWSRGTFLRSHIKCSWLKCFKHHLWITLCLHVLKWFSFLTIKRMLWSLNPERIRPCREMYSGAVVRQRWILKCFRMQSYSCWLVDHLR